MGNPRPLVAGFLCQVLFMPAVAFAIASALRSTSLFFPDEFAVGLLLIGCMPGGTMSNFYAYVSGADVALSIVMTCVSSVLALGTVPLALFVTTMPFTTSSLRVDFLVVAMSMLLVLVPAVAGITLRRTSPRAAKIVERVAAVVGVVFIIAAIVVGSALNPGLWRSAPAAFIASLVLLPAGVAAGFTAAAALHLPLPQRVALSLEVGIQNTSVPIAIAIFTYTDPVVLNAVLVVPLIYTGFLNVQAVLVTAGFKMLLRGRSAAATAAPAAELPAAEDGRIRSVDGVEVWYIPRRFVSRGWSRTATEGRDGKTSHATL